MTRQALMAAAAMQAITACKDRAAGPDAHDAGAAAVESLNGAAAKNVAAAAAIDATIDRAGGDMAPAISAPVAPTTGQFVRLVTESDDFAIAAARLAERRSASLVVRKLAAAMIVAHEATTTGLRAVIAGNDALSSPPTMNDDRHAMLTALRRAPAGAFDHLYLDQQIRPYQDLSLPVRRYPDGGNDAALRAFARPTASRIRHRLEYRAAGRSDRSGGRHARNAHHRPLKRRDGRCSSGRNPVRSGRHRTTTGDQPAYAPTELPLPVRPPRPPGRHSIAEDVYAILIGSSFITLGLLLLRQAGLVTGGMTGVALLLSYVVPLPAGLLFALLNLPFFLFAARTMGRGFTVKTVIVNLLITALSFGAPLVVRVSAVNPLFAALFGGTIIGMGILALARHQAGVGGIGVVAIHLQRTRGWNAGRTQIACDMVILAASLPVIGVPRFGLSLLSAAAISGVLIAYHRPGRYTGH